MSAPLPLFLGSLAGRVRSGRPVAAIPGSGSVVAVLDSLRRGGSLVGFRRRPGHRLELLFRAGLPPPRPLPFRPLPGRGVAALPPAALLACSAGLRPAATLTRSRKGGIPLLLPFGR